MPYEYDPVDHKDAPGDYRSAVRSGVFQRVGAAGAAVLSREQIVGDWTVSFVGVHGEKRGKPTVYRFRPDGQAIIEMEGQPPSTRNEWRLNVDGTFSLMVWCDAMPKYGLLEPGLEEDRMHLAVIEGGSLVLWNGDGSLVKMLSRHSEGGSPPVG
jgi:hypothetical protein